ncbi:MAG: hypothetical protein WBO70_06375 [Erysipelotrichaceae bacterium]
MMDVIIELELAIKDFKEKFIIEPNYIFLNNNASTMLNKMLENRIGLIEYYPEIFTKTFKVINGCKRVSVGIMI